MGSLGRLSGGGLAGRKMLSARVGGFFGHMSPAAAYVPKLQPGEMGQGGRRQAGCLVRVWHTRALGGARGGVIAVVLGSPLDVAPCRRLLAVCCGSPEWVPPC